MFKKQTLMRKIAASCALVAFCFMLASFSPSLDGRAVVASAGEFPSGLFAKTVGYLPGDSILVSNIAAGRTLDILVVGSLDPSEGVAILLSPESAEALGIQRNADIIVKITKRSGQLDEAVSGTAVIAAASTISDESESSEVNEPFVAQEEGNAVTEMQNETLVEPQGDFLADSPRATADSRTALGNDENYDVANLPDAADLPAQNGATINKPETPFNEPYVADTPFSDELFRDVRVTDEPSVELAQTEDVDVPASKNIVSDKVIVEYVPVEGEERSAVAQSEETSIAERFDAETPAALDERQITSETQDDTPAREVVVEDLPAENEERPVITETDMAERFSAEDVPSLEDNTADDTAISEIVTDDVPAEDDEKIALTEETEEAPISDESDIYEAIVLEPAPAAAAHANGTDTVVEATPVVPADSDEIAALTTRSTSPTNLPSDLNRYVVGDISSLEQGKYYVQIAALSDTANIRNTVSKYEADYPLVLVPLSSGRAIQVMIGPLGVDEYGVVIARFKSYGFTDAFLRQKN